MAFVQIEFDEFVSSLKSFLGASDDVEEPSGLGAVFAAKTQNMFQDWWNASPFKGAFDAVAVCFVPI